MAYKINAVGKTVLIIGDTHIPYSHPDYLPFLKHIKSIWKPQIVLHAGDELDYHAISFHKSDSSLFSADQELDTSIEELQSGLHKLWPKMYLLESNHGSLIYRNLKFNQIPIRVLKPLHVLYGTPRWTWHHDILLKTALSSVYVCHGKTPAYGKLCKEVMCSAAQGHHHGKLSINWFNSAMGARFDAFVGCLVDKDSMAQAYGRNNLQDPLLGSLILDTHGVPRIMKMQLDNKGRWNGKI